MREDTKTIIKAEIDKLQTKRLFIWQNSWHEYDLMNKWQIACENSAIKLIECTVALRSSLRVEHIKCLNIITKN